jgi:hypothetical protein
VWGAIILVVIICAAGFIFSLNYQSNKIQDATNDHHLFLVKFNTELKVKEGIEQSQRVLSLKNDIALAIDEGNKRIYLYRSGTLNGILKSYSYKDILQVEIIEDNVSITKTSRSSQIGGALLGGALAGGVGAVIGGLSGKTYSSDNVRNMDIRILINDTKHPEYVINVLNNMNVHGLENKKGISKGDMIYQISREKANHWHGLLSVLIIQVDKNGGVPEQNKEIPSNADEIRKLKELMDQDIISKEEFKQQRRKLLS